MAQVTHLFDSSALLCWYFQEPGFERLVHRIEDDEAEIALSALSLMEFWSVLKREGREAEVLSEWESLRPMFADILPADEAVGQRALILRQSTTARIPAIDALIAATAAVHGAVLVHRDPHFRAIPENLLRQEYLG